MADTLLIYGAHAGDPVVAVAACNEKSRNKSLEQNELWIVDPVTGRVLPYGSGGERYDRFIQRESWWEVRLIPAADGAQEGDPTAAPDVTAAPDSTAGPDSSAASPAQPVLSALGDLIAERRRTLPEGSYTTHLFTKGPEKIRKKVGEEAVEFILASDPAEMRSEAADLVYHMMVLLEAEGLRIDDVLAELDRRHQNG